jgi:DNA polymerase III subunit epsilon
MREIVLDTETTGLDPDDGHRIIEIACVELLNHVPTGRVFHRYINPERDVPPEARAIHGITTEFLRPHPVFAAVADDFLNFLAGDGLVIHNAEFDLKFINAELVRLGRAPLDLPHVDTVLMARKRFPGSPASLDALCRRYSIDLSQREKHSAQLDCELLAKVYLELIGGRQPGLDFAASGAGIAGTAGADRVARPPRPHAASEAELQQHRAFLVKLRSPLWLADE